VEAQEIPVTTTIVQIDAFTDHAFTGNPAAVCLLDTGVDDIWMQQVAGEMNLSETAFLRKRPDGSYDLRWFTPAAEVDLCGHATLASAHFLWERMHVEPHKVCKFHTKSGLLTAERKGDWIEMDFPSEPAKQTAFPTELARALGVGMEWVGQNRLDYLVEVESEKIVRELEPDFPLIAQLGTRGVIVTAACKDVRYDFVSRYFAPRYGIPEDPVTGSAHCALGPYWGPKLDKAEMVGYQASPRGGVVKVAPQGSRCKLLGRAVTVMRGQLV
jgi:PhzF family phenazine biosynthesis protein